MIDEATAAEIRRLHYAEHWPHGTIATQLGIHRDVVARVLGQRSELSTTSVRPSGPAWRVG